MDPSYSSRLHETLDRHGVPNAYYEYDDDYEERWFHPFRPGANADTDSRARTLAWLEKWVGERT